jgi:hypothetical protein
MPMGFGLNFKLIKTKPKFKLLSLNIVENAYQNSSNRLIFLDTEVAYLNNINFS